MEPADGRKKPDSAAKAWQSRENLAEPRKPDSAEKAWQSRESLTALKKPDSAEGV